jgi:putative hydrolase of the HAD superfamily
MREDWLLIDADDTLWENNIYFEEAFEQFVDFLDHSSLTAAQVREVLDQIELANIKIHGYGSANFGRNLQECFRKLAERPYDDGDLKIVLGFAGAILERPMEVIEGVEETLAYLQTRRRLLLFTKGHPEEQKLKLDRSGLGRHFEHCEVVREKNAENYWRVAAKHLMNPTDTWMVGNSPKSDINPALEAGLNAVLVPHPRTWSLEKQDLISGPGRLLVVERFGDLRRYF